MPLNLKAALNRSYISFMERMFIFFRFLTRGLLQLNKFTRRGSRWSPCPHFHTGTAAMRRSFGFSNFCPCFCQDLWVCPCKRPQNARLTLCLGPYRPIFASKCTHMFWPPDPFDPFTLLRYRLLEWKIHLHRKL